MQNSNPPLGTQSAPPRRHAVAAPHPAPPPEEAQREVGAVVHAIRILRHLAAVPRPLGVAAIARETGISPSTCFNILRTLARARLCAFHAANKTYTLGIAVAELSVGLVGLSHAELLRPELERLALNYDMLIVLWRVTEDGHIVLVDRAHSHTAVRVERGVGLRLPALAGAVGRCVAAGLALPPAELRRRFATLRWQHAPAFADWREEVARAGETGFALDDGQLYRGLQTVAAVVVDQSGQPRFGLSGCTIAGQHAPALVQQLGAELHAVAQYAGAALFRAGVPPSGAATSGAGGPERQGG